MAGRFPLRIRVGRYWVELLWERRGYVFFAPFSHITLMRDRWHGGAVETAYRQRIWGTPGGR